MLFCSYLRNTTEPTAAVRFIEAAVRIEAPHEAILLLPRFVNRALRWAEGTCDGITGRKRIIETANCTNIATAAVILANALSRVDTDFYPIVSPNEILNRSKTGQRTFGLREITSGATGSSSSRSGAVEEDKSGDGNESSYRGLHF